MNVNIADPKIAAAELWADFKPIKTPDEYIKSLRGRDMKVYYLGERIAEPVDQRYGRNVSIGHR